MANLKNITDLPVAESTEGLNLIVEQNGAAKRVAADSVGKVKTVNNVMPDENGNVQIDTASSWNDLKDKPFGEVDGEIKTLDPKYLPDPFWVEEKRTLVVEGVPNDCYSDVQSQIEVGKEYTYFIDGIEYTGEGVYDSPDYYIHLYNAAGEFGCTVYDYGIYVSEDIFDPTVSHKIELVERVYHTHHDFMLIIKENDDTGEHDVKLIAGDFATAKAKILKGLPATAYVFFTLYGEGRQEVTNYVNNTRYLQQPEGEVCLVSVDGFYIAILPDNTIMID